jgi:peptidoglycan/LPS O-acetylase OafA/YrhL
VTDTELGRVSARRHYDLFDSLRAIAAIAVLCVHALQSTQIIVGDGVLTKLVSRLNVGVAIFFVISGFLLYRPFVLARMEGRGMPDVRTYAGRRVLRIVPAYWLALTALAIWPGLHGVFTGHFWVFYGFLQTYGISHATGLFPAWTLCLEVVFYLFLPFYALAIARTGRHARDVRPDVIGLAVLYVGSLAMHWYFAHIGYKHVVLFTSFPTSLDWFVPGMALAVASVAMAGREDEHALVRFVAARGTLLWVASAAAYIVLALALNTVPFVTPLGAVAEPLLYGLVAFLFVLPAVFGEGSGGLVRRILSQPALLWLGLISYGIYLWHWPFALWVGSQVTRNALLCVLITFAMTVVCATASWYLLERPLIAFGHRRFGRHRAAPAPA